MTDSPASRTRASHTGAGRTDVDSPEPGGLLDAVVATVAYADVFDMPIDGERLYRFLVGHEAPLSDVRAATAHLVDVGRLGRRDDLYFLPGREDVLAIHDERTARAVTMWDAAERWGRRIGALPFVKAVAVTGGLAVDSVADHDDIDYFIITRPGRLWLTRALILVLVKAAARDDIELCPNYIVSDRALDFDDQTIYVAREIAQMIPLVGAEHCVNLRKRNDWMFDHLPNATIAGDLTRAGDLEQSTASTLGERLLASRPFAPVERWEMRRKIAKLQTVTSRRPEVGTPDESSFSPEVCKGHMVGNAAGIDIAWRERIAAARLPR